MTTHFGQENVLEKMPINPTISQIFALTLRSENCASATKPEETFYLTRAEFSHLKNFTLWISDTKAQPCQNDYPLQVFIFQALFLTFENCFLLEKLGKQIKREKIN